MKKILFVEYWDIEDRARDQEVLAAIGHNLKLGFDRVYLVYSGTNQLPFNTVGTVEILKLDRLTFDIFLKAVDTYADGPALFILTNADIALDPNLLLGNFPPAGVVYALTRHEMNGELYSAREFSQDTWVMLAQPILKGAILQSSFPLGVPGCENRFAEILWSIGFRVINPSLTFVNYHYQAKESVYERDYRIYGCYRTIPPSDVKGPFEEGKLVYFHRNLEKPFIIC